MRLIKVQRAMAAIILIFCCVAAFGYAFFLRRQEIVTKHYNYEKWN